MKSCVCLTRIDWLVGETDTVTEELGSVVMVMTALDDLVLSARDVAVSVTVAGLGTEAGAV